MKKKYDPPPERDRPPPMFVGDEEAASAPLVSARADGAEAVPPHDVRVVTEGASMGRWVVLGPALLAVFILAMSVAGASAGEGGVIWGLAAACALLGWGAHWCAVKHRKEFRLTDEGLVLEVRHRVVGKPRVTCLPWAEIRLYTAVADEDEAFLYVVDHRGDTVTLHEIPPRAWAQEFVRRFAEQARLHGVPERPASLPRPEPGNASRADSLGCMGTFLWMILMARAGDGLPLSPTHRSVGLAAIVLASIGFHLWRTLDDDDVAYRDRTSRKLMARLRRWLRRVLNIPVT